MAFKRIHIFYIFLFSLNMFCQQKTFTQLSVNDGLSHSDAICLVQDNYSFLWIGTNSGLNKFDGYTIKVYKWEPNDSTSIPGNRILKLIATKDKIWILIENKGLICYNLLTESYLFIKSIPELTPENYMFDLDQNKNLWLYQNAIGLIKITFSHDACPNTKSIKEENILFDKEEAKQLDLRKLIIVRDQEFFVSANGEFYEYSKNNKKLVAYDKFSEGVKIRATLAYDDSSFLIGSQEGLFLWNSKLKIKEKIPIRFGSSDNKRVSINCIYKNNISYFLGTENGLYEGKFILQNGLKFIADTKPISDVKVNTIFRDKFNVLWVATSGYGLFYKNLAENPFGQISQPQENNNNNVFSKNYTSAIVKEKNTLWLGTKNGLFLYDLVLKKYIGRLKELDKKHIRFLFRDSQGEIWVGTFDCGVYRYRNRKLVKIYKNISHNTNSVSSNHIISISEDHLGRIWLANYSNGLDIYDKTTNSFQHLFYEAFNNQSISSNNLNYLFFDKKKKYLYVSTRDSGITVIHLEDKTSLKFVHANSKSTASKLSTDYIWSINSNSSDTLFVGTIGGGLNILRIGKDNAFQIDYVTRKTGLADNDIESILLDDQNRVWMGGRGISMYDLKTKKIINYDVNDGLQSNSFKIGSSYYDSINRIMYFGGVNGVNFFNPHLIKPSDMPSNISINGIEIFNTPVQIGDTINNRVLLNSKIVDTTSIVLKAKENEFSITYTPLNFISPKKNKIKYKLEPYQTEWIVRNYPDFKTTYSNLPTGDYLFKVAALNNVASPTTEIAQLKIKIEPHWYMTKVAVFIYVIAFIGLIAVYHRFTFNRQKIKEKLISAEKEQLLNQKKLDFFSRISHEIRTPLTLIISPLEDLMNNHKLKRNSGEVLESMSRHVNRLLQMVNKLLDDREMSVGNEVLKVKATKINKLVFEIFTLFKGKPFSKIIHYDFVLLQNEILLYIDREKIETVIINLLSNAFKFTPSNGEISLVMEIKGNENQETIFNDLKEPVDNYLKISVIDTGIGIPFNIKNKIFNKYYQIENKSSVETFGNGIGLATVKGICKLHHLKIDVKSTLNKGSQFSLRIPLGKKYLDDYEIGDVIFFSDDNYHVHSSQISRDGSSGLCIIDDITSIDKKILIVEDNIEIREYLNVHLEKYFKVLNADNGSIGFEMANREKPDIIISDVMMPVMDGMELCKRIKSSDTLHHIPIIMLTALSSTTHELKSLKLGTEGFIRKPFKIEVLLAKIASVLNNRKYILEYYSKRLYFIPESFDNQTEDDIFLMKIIKFIEENLTNEKFSVTFICQHMAMGRTKLYTKVKETTGVSIVQFVRDIRLKKAGYLLLKTTQTVEQISYQVGINNLKYFRKHFKIMYHLTPSEYRKQGV